MLLAGANSSLTNSQMALPAMDSKEIMEHFNRQDPLSDSQCSHGSASKASPHFDRLDNEEKVMVLGAVVCATVHLNCTS